MKTTIFAPATPIGGAIAVIRISGEAAVPVLESLFSPKKPFISREMRYGKLMDGEKTVDEVMACVFRAPNSYTGEDMAEIYTHGGYAVVNGVLTLLSKHGLTPAAPGEFTQRAFMNGKLKLDEAEAVMDVINAQTDRSAAAALEQLGGSVGRMVNGLENELTGIMAAIGAAIDYPDELEEDVFSQMPQRVNAVSARIEELIRSGEKGRLLRDGAKICILGLPNAGKSSLFNALVGRNRAIVTAIPGTTRDVVEETVDIEGVPVRLLDTAGLRNTDDEIEGIGVELAREAAKSADVTVLVFDISVPFTDDDRALIDSADSKTAVVALTKSDLAAVLHEDDEMFAGFDTVAVSAAAGEGLEKLKKVLAKHLLPLEESAAITNARHIALLMRAGNELDGFSEALELGADCAEASLHSALTALGEISGSAVTENVIDAIFSTFCVGK